VPDKFLDKPVELYYQILWQDLADAEYISEELLMTDHLCPGTAVVIGDDITPCEFGLVRGQFGVAAQDWIANAADDDDEDEDDEDEEDDDFDDDEEDEEEGFEEEEFDDEELEELDEGIEDFEDVDDEDDLEDEYDDEEEDDEIESADEDDEEGIGEDDDEEPGEDLDDEF